MARSKQVLEQAQADLAALEPTRFVQQYRELGWSNGEMAGVIARAGIRAGDLHRALALPPTGRFGRPSMWQAMRQDIHDSPQRQEQRERQQWAANQGRTRPRTARASGRATGGQARNQTPPAPTRQARPQPPAAPQPGAPDRFSAGADRAVNLTSEAISRAAGQLGVAMDRYWQQGERRPGTSPVRGKGPAEVVGYRRQQKVAGKLPDAGLRLSLPREILRNNAYGALGLLQGTTELLTNLGAMQFEGSMVPDPRMDERTPNKVLARTVRRLGETVSQGLGEMAESALPPSSSPWFAAANELTRSTAHEAPEWLLTEGAGKFVRYPMRAEKWARRVASRYTESRALRGAAGGMAKSAVEPPYGSGLHGRTTPGEMAEDKVKGTVGGTAKGAVRAVVPGTYPIPGDLGPTVKAVKRGVRDRVRGPRRRK